MLKLLSPLLGFALCLTFFDSSLPEAETPQMGQKIYSFEPAKSAELSIIVPSTWMTWIERGQALNFTINAAKEIFDSKTVRLDVARFKHVP